MSGEAQENALECLLFDPVRDPSLESRLAALMEEIRVARLVAHMRPYLPSSATAATQPMPQVHPAASPTGVFIPAQRTRTSRIGLSPPAAAEQARIKAARAARRSPPPGSHTPYSGSTR